MTKTRQWIFVAATGAWLLSGSGHGVAWAEEQVNSYTTSFQVLPSVAIQANGDFVVVWASSGSASSDTDSSSILGQHYASDGSTVGGEFQINAYTTSSQSRSSVAIDPDGDFVVVWQSDGSAGSDSLLASIQGRRFASNGSTIGGQFQINTYTTLDQTGASVAIEANGDFIVVWQSRGSAGSDSSGLSIQGQRFASNGSTIGGQFQVNSYITSSQNNASVAIDAAGDFVVIWQSYFSGGTDTSPPSIQAQRYASDGSPFGGQFQVNSYTTSDQRYPSLAVDAEGDFIVVWQSGGSSGSDTDSSSVQGQRFASNGSTIGGQFQVNTYTTALQFNASVAIDSDGDFVIVWTSQGSGDSDMDSLSVQGQRYDSDGSTVGGQFQVNTYTTSFQSAPSAVFDKKDGLIIVWQSGGSGGSDTSETSIQKTATGFVPVELLSFVVE